MIDTLRKQGLGMPVNDIGMIWSGFRPSDDACDFHFNLPSNMFAVVTLRQMQEVARYVYRDEKLASEMAQLEEEIQHAITLHGIVDHPKYGRIYAFETDGFGNHVLMDDAGTLHEGFHKDDPSIFTRDWFAWSNSSFAQLVRKALQLGLLDDDKECQIPVCQCEG